MNRYCILWEDADNRREVEIMVDYRFEQDLVQIEAVRPIRITFVDAKTGVRAKSIGIHTENGRRVIARAYEASRYGLPRLEDEIYQVHTQRLAEILQPV